MTRVNVVPPSELCNKHLMAEYREMPRLVGSLKKTLNRKGKPFCESEISDEYKLGTGHVKFFYNKFKWLHDRHINITSELLKRGFNISNTDSNLFLRVDSKWYNDYCPTFNSLEINRKRIKDRMPSNPRWEVK